MNGSICCFLAQSKLQSESHYKTRPYNIQRFVQLKLKFHPKTFDTLIFLYKTLIVGTEAVLTNAHILYFESKIRNHQENMSVQCIPPKTPLLYSKTGVCRGISIFLIFAPKHRSHNLCFEQK